VVVSGDAGKLRQVIAESAPMPKVLELVHRAASSDTTVLITGESGTGKEVVAHAIHRASARRDRRFVPVNCGAMPEPLFEAELFGYAKGAFTGPPSITPGCSTRPIKARCCSTSSASYRSRCRSS
jgi:transcriptional regulator with PAS, ATPase and Fis domain